MNPGALKSTTGPRAIVERMSVPSTGSRHCSQSLFRTNRIYCKLGASLYSEPAKNRVATWGPLGYAREPTEVKRLLAAPTENFIRHTYATSVVGWCEHTSRVLFCFKNQGGPVVD